MTLEERGRYQERERLRRLLIQVRDDLDELIDHLEQDVLPTRMVGASAHHGLPTMHGPIVALASPELAAATGPKGQP